MNDDRYWSDRVFSSKHLGNYRRLKAKYNAIDNIDYSDTTKINIRRDILQNDFRYGLGKDRELILIDEEVQKAKEGVFNYLDSVDNPYEVLFTEFVDDIVYGKRKAKVTRGATGFNDTAYDIASQYFLRGLEKKNLI